MKKFLLSIALLLPVAIVWSAQMPCAAPPFAAKVVRPNLIWMVDNSGSMGDQPHSTTTITVGSPQETLSWYGYFDPKKRYRYSSNRFVEDPAGPYPGNILNWCGMSRGDILRKVLTGGRASSTGGGKVTLRTEGRYSATYTYRRDANNYTRLYVYHDGTALGRLDVSYTGANAPIKINDTGLRLQVDIDSAKWRGVLHQIADEDHDGQWDPDCPACGLWFFNFDRAGHVQDYIGDPTVTLEQFSNHIRNEPFATWTPHAETYFEITHYVSQASPHYYNSDYTPNPYGNKDPYWDQRIQDTLWCARTFVICITDGESTQDAEIPNSDAAHLPNCNNLQTIGRPYTQANGYYFDEVAYYAHTTDLRCPGYRPLPDMQEITLFTIYTFGLDPNARTQLQLASRVGGFVDRNNNKVPDLQIEWDEDLNGIPDNYFEAQTGQQLEAAILKAISMIMARVASGSPSAVVSSGARSEGLIYQSLFWPRKFEGNNMVDWTGRMHSLWIDRYGYIREDNANPGWLDLKQDYVIKMDTTGAGMAERYRDPTGQGIDSLLQYQGQVHVDLLHHVWNGGEQLHTRDPNTRSIFTWIDLNGNNQVDWPNEYIDFTTGNVNDIAPHLDVGGNLDTARALIRYVRGEEIAGHRTRILSGNVWKLSDIVYSATTYVGKPQEGYSLIYYDDSYKRFYNLYSLATPPPLPDSGRNDAIYVGANDGMLHCFNAGKFISDKTNDTIPGYLHNWGPDSYGRELWAYIPFNLLPHLKWLWDNNYCHVYYVDLKPYVTDAKIFAPDNVHRDGWGTVLIGGMRLGGSPITVGGTTYRSAYFAFDITKPKDGNLYRPPRLLWEFTEPDLKFTTCNPTVVKCSTSWFLVFGSGPASLSGTAAATTAKVYVLDLYSGRLLRKFDLPPGDSMIGDITSVDVGLNYSTEYIYFGTYNSRARGGKLWRISTLVGGKESPDPNQWTLSQVINVNRPVYAPPSITMDFEANLWVYFGTGRFYNQLDEADNSVMCFYGIKDDGISVIDTNDLYDVTNIWVKGDSFYIGGVGPGIAYDSLVSLIRRKKGWFRRLVEQPGNVAAGERALSKPLVIGGAVLFTSGTPSGGDVCVFGGSGKLYALYYLTGAPYKKPILGKNVMGWHQPSVSLGSGMPAGAGLFIGSDREKAFIQSATGGVRGIQMKLPFSPRGGQNLWKSR